MLKYQVFERSAILHITFLGHYESILTWMRSCFNGTVLRWEGMKGLSGDGTEK